MKIKENKYIFLSIAILFFISAINLYNAKFLNPFYSNYYIKQSVWFILGIVTLFFSRNINLKWLFKYSKYFYFINVLLLIIVLFVGDAINGTRAWLDFKIFSFQPSEFMKLTLTLYLIEISEKKEKKLLNILKMTLITLIPSLLVFLEPDTGAIIFYLIVYFYLITTKKIKWYYYLLFLFIFILGITAFIYFYHYNQDLLINLIGTSFFYRVDRFINFRNNNYQLELAMLSIFGSPFIRNGLNQILIYIPEGATDFIFAFSIGNFGIISAFLIIFCYAILLYNLLSKLKLTKDKKTNYLVISFVLILLFQIIINILMNIGLIPIIGITLPFLSYGGSSIIVNFLFLAIILNLTNKDNYYHKVRNKNKSS